MQCLLSRHDSQLERQRSNKRQSLERLKIDSGYIFLLYLQNFIDIDLWDEAIIITNNFLQIEKGVTAPILRKEILLRSDELFFSAVFYFTSMSRRKDAQR